MPAKRSAEWLTAILTTLIPSLAVELREAKVNECDVEGVLNFAEHVMTNAAGLWTEFSLEQKQRFQRVLFPEGVSFSDGKFGTAATLSDFQRVTEFR